MDYSLTLKKGNDSKGIAIIRGGKQNGKIVYLTKNDTDKALHKNLDYDELEHEMMKLKIRPRERVKLYNEIEELHSKNISPKDLVSTDKHLVELYKFCCNSMEDDKELKLGYGETFEILPSEDPKKSGRYYIAGMSESGKSYIAKQIIDNYHSLFPKRKIYVISKLKKDETLDSSKAKLIRIDPETFLEDPPTIEEFAEDKIGCLVVFDDFDNFKGKLGNIIQTFIDDCLQMGRHHNISTIICTHFITNYKQSSIKLAESQYYIVFPHGATSKKLSYLLGSYAGVSEKQVKMMKKMGRWIALNRVSNPKYVISEQEIKILNPDDE